MPPAKKSSRKATARGPAKKAVAKKPANKTAPSGPAVKDVQLPAYVPDTSVLVDGRLTLRIQRGDLQRCRIFIPNASLAELEHQANQGRESGFAGLDEVVKIQELKDVAELEVVFAGERPSPEHVELARGGEIDALIRGVAVEHKAKLLTSDRVQSHVARALGLDVEYIRPIMDQEEADADLSTLMINQFFDDETMSVHLKQNVRPLAKRGTPAGVKLEVLSERRMELPELTRMRREIIEAAQRDANSFIEIERHGATVVQLGKMRIAIAQPPFSDAMEITAVRPIVKLELPAYKLESELEARLQDYQRGVFVSGPPGSGKSTFVTAVAEWLKDKNTIVKTMESPRDLQVSDEITQYAPLDKDMALTSDVLLLVRPDFVIYDEVRRTSDFETFADMRLAGVGLIGVTHANRAIDAVQRLIGRVELGMIPQVVDTVIHIAKGKVDQVLELSFTVKTPHGMQEADLARPVIEVKDFLEGGTKFEIYTYGEQVVVMPVGGEGAGGERRSGRDKLASDQLNHMLRRYIDGPFEVEVSSDNKATLYVPQHSVPMIIGKGGSNIKYLEEAIGMKMDVRPFQGRERSKPVRAQPARATHRGQVEEDEDAFEDVDLTEEEDLEGTDHRRYAEVRPELRKSKKNVVLLLRREFAGERVHVVVDDEPLFTATVSGKGEVRISRDSEAGERLMDALAKGGIVTVRI